MRCSDRVLHIDVLLRIPHATIDDRAQTAQLLRPRRHQSAPAGRGQALGLLDVHDVALLVRVGEMERRCRAGALRLDHLHGDGWSVDACSAAR